MERCVAASARSSISFFSIRMSLTRQTWFWATNKRAMIAAVAACSARPYVLLSASHRSTRRADTGMLQVNMAPAVAGRPLLVNYSIQLVPPFPQNKGNSMHQSLPPRSRAKSWSTLRNDIHFVPRPTLGELGRTVLPPDQRHVRGRRGRTPCQTPTGDRRGCSPWSKGGRIPSSCTGRGSAKWVVGSVWWFTLYCCRFL